MTRAFSLTKAKSKNGNGHQPAPTWAPPEGGAEAELVAGPLLPERYESRPARPFTAIAIRVALWGAVAFGCLGGIVGLVRPPAKVEAPATVASDGQAGVPAPVAGMAELVTREWLTASVDENEDDLRALFVEPPALDGLSAGDLTVGRVTTIAGRVLQEQYWAVTVEAEVTETVTVVDETDPGAGEDPNAVNASNDSERRTSIWYLEVPIVGNPETGLLALTTPSVLPGPPVAETGWTPSVNEPVKPNPDDPTLQTVEGFLDALLAGTGDPSRYVAPRVKVTPANPPPFADTEVVDVAIDQLGEGEYRVLARVKATTPGGARQMFSYELVVVERVDRLEITQFSGAPTMVAGTAEPPEPENADGEDGADDGGSDGTSTDSTAPDSGNGGSGNEAPGSSVPDTTGAPAGSPGSTTAVSGPAGE
ncbi:MAG TPA: hypothetical protein VGO78_09060 [Acidimicrobiales bacterium]|nr:hypothetical protein [Acidimicrobiales bacterium]